ncbi:hypothetical protein Unana1_06386 [Umbelopsis nana]
MDEIVVYEDTPFAEYLQEIDGSEDVVASESLSNTGTIYDRIRSLASDYWNNYSFSKDLITPQLPRAEQIVFTEEFKYLIVTSSLLSENISMRSKSIARANEPSSSTMSNKPQNWDVAAYALGILLIIGTNRASLRHWPDMRRSLNTTITSSLSLSVTFMFYRNMRRKSLRQCHMSALRNLTHLIKQCRLLDTRVNRILNMIQEIELVSRGYRITTPLPPISRIEQNSKHRRCQETRKKLYILLNRAIFKLNCSIANVTSLVDESTVLHLYDLYNAHSGVDPTILMESQTPMMQVQDVDKLSLDFLKQICLAMHLRRREFLIQLLALRVVNTGKPAPDKIYRQEWEQIQQEIGHLAKEIENIALESIDILNDVLYSGPPQESGSVAKDPKQQGDANAFLKRLASLQQQLRTLQAKMFLCHEDAQRVGDEESGESRSRITQQFMSMSQDFDMMMKEWQQGQEALRKLLNPEPDTQIDVEAIAEDTVHKDTEPIVTAHGEQEPVIGSEEQFDLPTPSRAQIFETVAELVNTEKARSKLSRAERIAKAKAQREKEVKDKDEKVDSQKMVHELKDVLGRRLADLEKE